MTRLRFAIAVALVTMFAGTASEGAAQWDCWRCSPYFGCGSNVCFPLWAGQPGWSQCDGLGGCCFHYGELCGDWDTEEQEEQEEQFGEQFLVSGEPAQGARYLGEGGANRLAWDVVAGRVFVREESGRPFVARSCDGRYLIAISDWNPDAFQQATALAWIASHGLRSAVVAMQGS